MREDSSAGDSTESHEESHALRDADRATRLSLMRRRGDVLLWMATGQTSEIDEEFPSRWQGRDGGRWLAAGRKCLGLRHAEASLPALHATGTPLTLTGATPSCGLVGRCLVDSPGGGSDGRAGDGPRAYTARVAVLLPPKRTASDVLLLLPCFLDAAFSSAHNTPPVPADWPPLCTTASLH